MFVGFICCFPHSWSFPADPVDERPIYQFSLHKPFVAGEPSRNSLVRFSELGLLNFGELPMFDRHRTAFDAKPPLRRRSGLQRICQGISMAEKEFGCLQQLENMAYPIYSNMKRMLVEKWSHSLWKKVMQPIPGRWNLEPFRGQHPDFVKAMGCGNSPETVTRIDWLNWIPQNRTKSQ